MFKTLELEKRAIISINLCEKTLKIKSKHLRCQRARNQFEKNKNR